MDNAARLKENRMGVEPINGLLVKMSFPIVVSMMVMALYNVVDSIFVSRIGEDALTAVSMCFPIQQAMIAISVGTGVGIGALLSRFLGARDFERVDEIAKNGIFLAVCSYFLFVIIGFFAEPFIAVQTDNKIIIEYGSTYLYIVCFFSITIFIQIVMEKLLQGTGQTKYIFLVQVSGAIINIIMDPILIFGMFGAPKLGVAGAAYATVFGEAFAASLGLYFNTKKNKEINLNMKGFKPNWKEIKDIYRIGLPSVILQSVASVMVFGFNKILVSFTTSAVAVFGVFFRLQSFIFMPVFGISSAVIPIAAYNYGARKRERIETTMRLSTVYAVAMMSIGTIAFWFFPKQLLGIFNPSEEMIKIGVWALRIISVGFPMAGYAILRGSIFQSLGKSVYSMNISLVRQLGIILPSAFLLSKLGNINYVWFSFLIAEIIGISMSVMYTYKIRREIINQI